MVAPLATLRMYILCVMLNINMGSVGIVVVQCNRIKIRAILPLDSGTYVVTLPLRLVCRSS